MREYNLSSSKGKKIYEMGCHCYKQTLRDMYNKWSPAKEKGFNWCWEQYCIDENSSDFGVGNENSYGFTASWCLTKDGEDCLRVETRDNSYLVYLNR